MKKCHYCDGAGKVEDTHYSDLTKERLEASIRVHKGILSHLWAEIRNRMLQDNSEWMDYTLRPVKK